jgi:hypothetical protein
MEFLAPVLKMRKDLGFFDFLTLLEKQGFQFAKQNPQSVQIGRDIMISKTLEKEKLLKTIIEEAYSQIQTDPNSLYLELIKNAITRKEITDAYSPETINFYVQTMIEGVNKRLLTLNISDPFGKEGEAILEEFISILKHGFCIMENKK